MNFASIPSTVGYLRDVMIPAVQSLILMVSDALSFLINE